MIKKDQTYIGKIREGSCLIATQSGSLGYQLMLECEDGQTSFMIWLTPKNRVKAEKYLALAGADISKLSDSNYLDYQLAQEIVGKEIRFGTHEEIWNGKTSIKVGWIGKVLDPNLSKTAARFFAGDSSASQAGEVGNNVPAEEDIPF